MRRFVAVACAGADIQSGQVISDLPELVLLTGNAAYVISATGAIDFMYKATSSAS